MDAIDDEPLPASLAAGPERLRRAEELLALGLPHSPRRPTPYRPGSAGKLAVLIARREARRRLFHPQDAPLALD